jgi:hypothetical protein
MRLLRGVAGRSLPCGCLVGIYETYEGSVVATIDARGAACTDAAHVLHAVVIEAAAEPDGLTPPKLRAPHDHVKHQ